MYMSVQASAAGFLQLFYFRENQSDIFLSQRLHKMKKNQHLLNALDNGAMIQKCTIKIKRKATNQKQIKIAT